MLRLKGHALRCFRRSDARNWKVWCAELRIAAWKRIRTSLISLLRAASFVRLNRRQPGQAFPVHWFDSHMLELFESHPRPDVQEAEYLRLLGFPPGHTLDERPRQLADWARHWYAEHGRPWIFFRRAGPLQAEADGIRLLNIRFASSALRTMFLEAQANDAMLVAVSAGPECETQARQCWEEGKPDEYFFLEMFGSAVVEHLVTQAAGKICAWADGC